jgi:hypothetical protein
MQTVYTTGYLARQLGVSDRTMQRALDAGKVEEPLVEIIGPNKSYSFRGFTAAQVRRIKKRGLRLYDGLYKEERNGKT